MRKVCVVASCAALALVLAVPAGVVSARKGGDKTKVVCLNNKTLDRVYKVTPRRCIFHQRHSPKAEAFFVRTTHDHWSVWNRDNAKGKGRQQPSMGPSTPVRIRLRDPVRRCGHRVFSRAHFRYPKVGGGGSTMKLNLCA